MSKCYKQLSVDERNQMQRGLNAGQSLRALARSMNRSPGTLSKMLPWWLKAQLRCCPWSGLGADATSAWPVQAVAWNPLDGAGACADSGTYLVTRADCREATRGTSRRL